MNSSHTTVMLIGIRPRQVPSGVLPWSPELCCELNRFSFGTSPVDWPGFPLDPETVSAVFRDGEVPGRPQHRGTEGPEVS